MSKLTTTVSTNRDFAEDIQHGLEHKYIPYKYLFDAEGSLLFQKLMHSPSYYLTKCELEIFKTYADEITSIFTDKHESFNLIELGSGDATKTKILLQHFLDKNLNFSYTPIDISKKALEDLSQDLDQNFSQVAYQTIHGDYQTGLQQIEQKENQRQIVLFLGSTIGNLKKTQTYDFLKTLRTFLRKGDLLLMGFDLKKRPELILNAYNDSRGLNADFILNGLERINKELGGNFKSNNYRYYPSYNPQTGNLDAYIVCQKPQTVYISSLELEINLKQWESIHVAFSQKYTVEEIECLATETGFKHHQSFLDSKDCFLDAIWVNP
ncbi:MAG: L-histidine N(alpha)-methyltransferase [Saprospiraceae bacterium]|nr:L-histidine N(alpha)-methyltransferase [Saprospiraceae bacterium]